ncbi:MAG: agmatinase [Candidatus Blackburnbacteria bacterium]|nr:agmatinase [Candidatus Blackburnbacteria bacterium]
MAKKNNKTSTASRKNYQPNKKDFYPELNFALIERESSDFENSAFVVLSVPYDAVTSFKAGAREGPGAIIDSSQFLELYDQELKKETYKAGIHTLPEVIPAPGNPEAMMNRIYRVASELLGHKKIVVALGGDHSISTGAVKAHIKAFPKLSVLQFDAHPDLRDIYEGTPYSSATVARRIVEMGARVVQVGLRALSNEDMAFAKKAGIPQFFAEDMVGGSNWIERVVSELTDNVYISFDVDFFDPSIMAATGTPEPGGPGWYDALKLLREVAKKRRVVGFDVVELSPSLGPHSCAFLAAKLVYKIMGYISEKKK